MKECEFEVKGTHSLEEMLKLVEVHATEAHRTIKLSPETLERIRLSVKRLEMYSSKTRSATVQGRVQIKMSG